MTNHCGSCTVCCKVFSIKELGKPAGKWCQMCAIGKGCKIYNVRPPTCVNYECMWLHTQSLPEANRLPAELRPDKCKVVFSPTTRDDIMSVTTMTGYADAWKKPAIKDVIDFLIKGGIAVAIGPPAATTVTMLSRNGMAEVRLSEPDENGIQWNIEEKV